MKKIYSREEFKEHLNNSALEMKNDKDLQKDKLKLISKADKYNWIHQTSWLGEPILKLPQDMFAIQDIIFKNRPDYIIELGIAWGGQLLFYSTLMETLGGVKIIGVDTYIPDDLKERIYSHKNLANRIELISGSSIEDKTINNIKEIIGDSKNVMVILDTDHSHDHVLKELYIYEKFVGIGHYLICGNTIIELIPEQIHRKRPWGPGNNPMTALDVFLEKNKKFISDLIIDDKLLLSCNYRGFLKKISDL
jgi:cephalosporin hydroxylase